MSTTNTRNYRQEYVARNTRSLQRYGLTYYEQRRVRSLPDAERRLALAEARHSNHVQLALR